MQSNTSTIRSRRARHENNHNNYQNHLPNESSSSSKTSPSRSSSAKPFNTWSSSFSAVQGFASSVIGKDTLDSFTNTFSIKPSRTSSPHRPTTPQEWGPTGLEENNIGAGSNDGRVAKLRDAKRTALLDGNTRLIKRKDSNEFGQDTIPVEQDALAYLHKVQPGDTMAGLTIKYNCSAQVLRKANRMWPNDPIQTREIILIPVDACALKGKKVPAPDDPQPDPRKPEIDLLSSEPIDDSASNGWAQAFNLSQPTQPSSSSSDVVPSSPTQSSTAAEEPLWKHDSWVQLPSSQTPTQIVRLSRQNLSYFPRPRRKSTSTSQGEFSRGTSLELTRPPTSSSPRSPNLTMQRSPSGSMPPPPVSRRGTTKSSASLISYLSGPGGVGSLDRSTRSPGPGKEKLTEMFAPKAQEFVAPPSSITVYTPWTPALLAADDPTGPSISGPDGSGTATPTPGQSMDLQDVSLYVERWMRKMTKKAANALEEAGRSVANSPKVTGRERPDGAAPDGGDLIEMMDGLDLHQSAAMASVPATSSASKSKAAAPASANKGAVTSWDVLNRDAVGGSEMRGRRLKADKDA